MAASEDRPTGVICDDRPGMRAAVRALLDRCGFTTVGTPEDLPALTETVGRTAPHVAVLALPVPGSDGLAAVGALRRAAPGCEVVVLSPFAGLEAAALQSGARALVGEDDLRALQAVLVDVAAEVRGRPANVPPAQRMEAALPAVLIAAWGAAGTVRQNPAS